MKTSIVLGLGLLLILPLSAIVEVYEYPDVVVRGELGENSRSTLFDVQISQEGRRYRAYVMYDKNQDPHGNLALNPDNHWTNFSFSGAVALVITRKDGKVFEWCKVLPGCKGISARLSGDQARLEIPAQTLPLQLFVDMNDMEGDALFIFADPLETDVPVINSGEVALVRPGDSIESVRQTLLGEKPYVVFDKGVHRWGHKTGKDYPGYKLPVRSGKRIYIPGGSCVIGTFDCFNQSDWKIYGRGILSACGLERIPNMPGIPYSMVHADGTEARNQKIEGLVSICPPHFHLTVRGEVVIDNVKMLSWWHQTDGTVTGDYSVVKNCFFKVCDDVIKVYSDHCIHSKNTIFQQVNGAPFQFAWGGQNGDHNVSINTYIVNSIYKELKDFSNTAVINAMGGQPGNVTENNRWDGIYIDNGSHRLLGLNVKGGTHRNLEIRNVVLNSGQNRVPQKNFSYLANGEYSDIRIINLEVDGVTIAGISEVKDQTDQGLLWFEGKNAGALSFFRE